MKEQLLSKVENIVAKAEIAFYERMVLKGQRRIKMHVVKEC